MLEQQLGITIADICSPGNTLQVKGPSCFKELALLSSLLETEAARCQTCPSSELAPLSQTHPSTAAAGTQQPRAAPWPLCALAMLPPGLPNVPLLTVWQGVGCSTLPFVGGEGWREISGACLQEGGKDDSEEGPGLSGWMGMPREDRRTVTSSPASLSDGNLLLSSQLQGLRSDLAQGQAGCRTQGAGLPSEDQGETNLLISC